MPHIRRGRAGRPPAFCHMISYQQTSRARTLRNE